MERKLHRYYRIFDNSRTGADPYFWYNSYLSVVIWSHNILKTTKKPPPITAYEYRRNSRISNPV